MPAESDGRLAILVVEDDDAIRIGLEEKLAIEGFAVRSVIDGDAACTTLADQLPDLVVLDLMLPKKDGLAVLAWLRRFWPALPVLILSAKGREDEKVAGLRAGADDYLAKPFGLGELMARIRALLRRTRGPSLPIALGDAVVDLDASLVKRDGAEEKLSPKELEILRYLAQRRGRIVARRELFDAIWGAFDERNERQVDYHIAHLRKKIEGDSKSPRFLITHHGLGYELRGE